jgi:uncharacterized membrane protein
MAGFLSNFRNTMIVSVILALIMIVGYYLHGPDQGGPIFWQAVFRWMHVFFGILWIGLLYYFNFVQIRVMPNVPAELKPAVSKYIAPEALFWFRWAAMATWVMGVILAISRGYLLEAATLGFAGGFDAGQINYTFIGVGMWLATIMFVNVWAFIWPAQQIALGMKEADADAKAAAAKKAMMFSRINTLLSLPMLTAMAMNQTIFG